MLLAVGCTGAIGAPTAASSTSAPSPVPASTPGPAAPTAPPVPAPEPLGDAFTVTRGQLQLLPFAVRLSKLATIAGVATDHPILAPVLQARLSLGDHDYAHGVPADRSWSAAKLTAWVAAIRPLCASAELRARFPDLPTSLGPLIEVAYGRAAEPEDHALVAEALTELPENDAEARATAVCLAVLSSAELVAQ